MSDFTQEAFKLLNLSPTQITKMLAEYGEPQGFTSQDWVHATERIETRQAPKIHQFEAYLLEARRRRQGETGPARIKSTAAAMDPAFFRTNYLWNGQQVWETTDRAMSMWTLVKPDGAIENYLSDRPPTHAEQVCNKILAGPRAGSTLLGTDALYRAGVYTERGDETVWDPLPANWRTRPECTALKPGKPLSGGGWTSLGDVVKTRTTGADRR